MFLDLVSPIIFVDCVLLLGGVNIFCTSDVVWCTKRGDRPHNRRQLEKKNSASEIKISFKNIMQV